MDRRKFIFVGASAAIAGMAAYYAFRPGGIRRRITEAEAALRRDPEGVLDLLRGFSYRIISRRGMPMTDGLIVPGEFDGMAAFPAPNGRVALIRNHEVSEGDSDMGPFGEDNARLTESIVAKMYDPGAPGLRCHGGTTTLIYNPVSGELDAQFLSLAGTVRNCAGGPTPWNSWLSCEETLVGTGDGLARNHGYIFEVPAAQKGLAPAEALRAMGRFRHEAAAVDPATGVVYLTEDRDDSLLYRFLPATPGRLAAGGRLQALALDAGQDTRNWQAALLAAGDSSGVGWIDLPEPDRDEDDLRHIGAAAGAAIFARGEGAWWGDGELFFSCTSGGRNEDGQIWRLRPGAGPDGQDRLTLFAESADTATMNMPDNLTVAPWGDLLVCEDSGGRDRLLGIRPDGEVYVFARNALNWNEIAGVCFAPDGRTLFLNYQGEDLTFAVTGPWESLPKGT